VDHLGAERREAMNLGHDSFAGFKRRLDPDVRDYYVTALLFQGVNHSNELSGWYY
jgi:hypothetical protein